MPILLDVEAHTALPAAPGLARVLRPRQGDVAAAWLAVLDAGVWLDSLPASLGSEFTDRYLPTLVALLTHHIERPRAETAAVYRDELRRFELHDSSLPAPFGAADLARALRRALERVTGLDAAAVRDIAAWLDLLDAPLLRPAARHVDMLLIGDCLMNEVRCFVAALAHAGGVDINAHHLYFSASLSSVLDVNRVRALLERKPVELIGLSPFTFDALPLYRELLIRAGGGGRTDVLVASVLDVVEAMIAELHEVSVAPILLHNASGAPVGEDRPSLPTLPPLTNVGREAVAALNDGIAARARGWDGVVIIDEQALADRWGLEKLSKPALGGDRPTRALFHTSRLGQQLAHSYWDAIETWSTLGQVRVLAVDFDDTLWAGVVAEGDVSHHHDRQTLLRGLARQGLILVGLSSGTMSSLRWDGASIGPEDFLELLRDWSPKADNLCDLIDRLGVVPKHVAVVDNDLSQLALLAHAAPGITALDADDPATWRRLEALRRMSSASVTPEASGRLERARADERRRRVASPRRSYADLIATLDLRLRIDTMEPGDVTRAHELMRRTNQFNTTGVELSTAELERRIGNASHGMFVARLRDRFGDFGIVAVVVVAQVARPRIEQFAMSCRAMGYGVEQSILAAVVEQVGAPISARLVATQRNEPCHLLFSSCGFREDPPGWWTLDQPRSMTGAPCLTIEVGARTRVAVGDWHEEQQ